jgi:hypothetical protein
VISYCDVVFAVLQNRLYVRTVDVL